MSAGSDSQRHHQYHHDFITNSNFQRQLDAKLEHLIDTQTKNKKNVKKQFEDNNKPKHQKHLLTQMQIISQIPQKDYGQKQKKSKIEFEDLLTDRTMVNILKKYFNNKKSIMIYQFIQALCIQCGIQINSSHFDFQKLVQCCKKDLTTINSEQISLGALQILVKKCDIKSYLLQNYLQVKYKRKKKELQESYRVLFKQIEDREQNMCLLQTQFDQRDYQIKKKENQLQVKNKDLRDRQKQLNKKQKQLVQRDKSIKVHLQQRSQKLLQTYLQQLQKISNSITAQSQNFQRNAKLKLTTIERKREQLDFFKKKQITSLNQSKKDNTQQLINKIKRLQREIQKIKKTHHQEIVKIQEENKQFLKASTILQSRLQKNNKKIMNYKETLQENQKIIKLLETQNQQHQSTIEELLLTLKDKEQNKRQNNQTDKKKLSNSNSKLVKQKNHQTIETQYKNAMQILIAIQNQIFSPFLQKSDIKQQIFILFLDKIQDYFQQTIPLINFIISQQLQLSLFPQVLVNVVFTAVGLKKYQFIHTILNQEGSDSEIQQFLQKLQQSTNINLLKSTNKDQKKFMYYALYESIINSSDSVQTLQKVINCNQIKTLLQQSDSAVTYLLEKYLCNMQCQSYLIKGQMLTQSFLQVSNNECFLRSLFNLNNYRLIIKLLCSIPDEKGLTETLQKITIILQRLVYNFGVEIVFQTAEIKVISRLLKKEQKLEENKSQLLIGNLKSILSGIKAI